MKQQMSTATNEIFACLGVSQKVARGITFKQSPIKLEGDCIHVDLVPFISNAPSWHDEQIETMASILAGLQRPIVFNYDRFLTLPYETPTEPQSEEELKSQISGMFGRFWVKRHRGPMDARKNEFIFGDPHNTGARYMGKTVDLMTEFFRRSSQNPVFLNFDDIDLGLDDIDNKTKPIDPIFGELYAKTQAIKKFTPEEMREIRESMERCGITFVNRNDPSNIDPALKKRFASKFNSTEDNPSED